MRIKLATQIGIAGAIAVIVTAFSTAFLVQRFAPLSWFMVSTMCLASGLIVGLSMRWFFQRHTQQISRLVEAMEALSIGNFTVDVDSRRSRGEIQVLVDRFNDMREKMRDRQRGLKRKARRDRLTGLFNRAYLESQLPLLENWAIDKDASLTALMLDLDNFKAWNDGLGHAAGDLVLQCVAENLRKGCRDTDLIARMGGDEFVVIALGLDLVAAASLAERLRHSVFEALDEQARKEWGDQEDDRTLALYSGRLQDLLINADAALYDAKRAGRNQVKVFNDIERDAA